MKYKLLSVENIAKTNIGDYIQALASSQFLPQVDGFIDREKLKDYDGEESKVIMNGWYIHNTQQWPPSPKIVPLYVAVHINKSAAHDMLTTDGLNYLKKYEPIGCRDLYTYDLLQQHGIDAYFSGCMTLTLGYKYVSKERGKEIYFVDPFVPWERTFGICMKDLFYMLSHPRLISQIARKYTITENRLKNYYYNSRFVRLYSRLFTKDTLLKANYISQENTHYTTLDNKQRMAAAEALVQKYSKAAFVVTSRIHCALPCTGLGTPVYFVNRAEDTEISTCRFGGLIYLFHTITVFPDKIESNFEHMKKYSTEYIVANKDSWKSLAEDLISKCRSFVREKDTSMKESSVGGAI